MEYLDIACIPMILKADDPFGWNKIFFPPSCPFPCLSQGTGSNCLAHNWWQSPVSRMDQKQHKGLTFTLIKILMKLSKHLLKTWSNRLPFGLYVWMDFLWVWVCMQVRVVDSNKLACHLLAIEIEICYDVKRIALCPCLWLLKWYKDLQPCSPSVLPCVD